ncbi:hypothetical protein ATCVCanal1_275R [Acanthocystis turfacea Chlorella virus Canal-1]|nr:hypothetical protein ATCVCanal1_275R [Acanthocystis turfacea Chlorella virus Canal-1]
MDINKFIERSADGKRAKLVIPVRKFFRTDGNGHWSKVAKRVFVTRMEMEFYIDDPEETEHPEDAEYPDDSENHATDFCIYFARSWNTRNDGLIYTDKTFMGYVHDFLIEWGLDEAIVRDIHYSEQGMQSRVYVSCDAYDLEKYMWPFLLTNVSSHTSDTS